MAEGLAEMGANLVLWRAQEKSAACRLPKNCKTWRRGSRSRRDVKQPASISGVADTAVKQFGRIDI